MKKSIVITGADGFIGSHLVRSFAADGYSVYALTIENSPLVERIAGTEGVQIFQVDLRRWDEYCEQLPQNPEAFVHLAWAGVSPEHRENTLLQMDNVTLAMEAVRLAAKLHAQRFVIPGSTAEYAYSGQIINNKVLPSPQNAYGAAKIAARYLCGSLCEELGVPYIYVVISGIYAADRRDRNVIYYTIETLLRGEKPHLTRLEQMWDYVHIEDVVEAFRLIAKSGRNGAFYAVGHGDNCPLSEYIKTIHKIIDPALPLGIGDIPYKDKRMPSSCIDLRSLQEDTGFVPRIPFEQGIKEVIDQVRKEMRG